MLSKALFTYYKAVYFKHPPTPAVDNKSAIVPGLSMRSSRDIYYSKKTLLRISANTVPEIDLALGQQRTKHSVSLNIALVIEDPRR